MKKILFLLTLLFFFVGCDSDDNSLPPETQEGKNTFGFTMNGNVFKGRSFTPHSYAGYSRETLFSLYRDGYVDSLRSDFSLNIIVHHSIEEGKTYLLSAKPERHPDSLRMGDFGEISYYVDSTRPDERWGRKYTTSKKYTGELTITKLDTQKKIVSGRFWFDVWTAEYGVVKIREGRFDTKYVNNN